MARLLLIGFGDPEFWRKLVDRFFESDSKSFRHGRLEIWAAIGFGVGIYWFFKGLWTYRKCRVIEDTPETPIRSIAMGLVEVHGKAVGEPGIRSPVTRTPCFFYKVNIEKWQSDQKGQSGTWRHYKTDYGGAQFDLEDPTGKVLVDAHGADLDLNPVDKREVEGFSGLFMPTADPADPVIDPEVAATFEASDREVLMYITKAAGKSGLLSGRYRVTEYCIEPEQCYDVTGTCAENPQARDEHDRNLIKKGQNEPTFMISVHEKKDLESTLRWKSMRGVFGGGALAIGCLAFLLMRFGWL
jgi:uncharacterized protein YjeT (DUF2065 family)